MTIVEIMLRIASEDRQQANGFVHSMATDPDYNMDTMKKAIQVLESKGIADESIINQFEQLFEEVTVTLFYYSDV